MQVVREVDRAHVGAGLGLQWAGAGAVGELELSVSVDPDRDRRRVFYVSPRYRDMCVFERFSKIVFGQ